MVTFNIYEAKTQLSRLLRQVRTGQEVVIADAGMPVAKLIPIEPSRGPRTLGMDRGKIWIAPDAFDPLTGDDLAAWDGALFPAPANRRRRRPSPPPSSPPRRPRRARPRAPR